MLLVNPRDSFDLAWDWLAAGEVSLTCALDREGSLYRGYGNGSSYAPFPLQVVVDRSGIITYVAWQYDADAVRTAIDAALAGD